MKIKVLVIHNCLFVVILIFLFCFLHYSGLGVCNLHSYFLNKKLISDDSQARQCIVVCTHVHFDHSGGAHNFENVFIHELDKPGLLNGRQTETLNYVKSTHFSRRPYTGFAACSYKVPPTLCQALVDGEHISLGGGENLEIIHVPGHTKGSICIYYPARNALFSGDFVYECGHGSNLFDWLPNSNQGDFIQSANKMLDFISAHPVDNVYPGHFINLNVPRVVELLHEYVDAKDNCCSTITASCLQGATWCFFWGDCFRCCPC